MNNEIGFLKLSHKREQDFEINIASIIDCFTVLITFLLASASFLSIGVFDAGIAAAGDFSTSTQAPALLVAIELKKDFSIEVRSSGKVSRFKKIPANLNKMDYENLKQELTSLKVEWPELNSATLSGESTVAYREIVQAMDQIRKTLPVVLLGGF